MPSYTTIALEALLEPATTQQHSFKTNSSTKSHPNEERPKPKPKPNHIYISPALYTTPAPTPICGSSSGSVSPSPYVFNRKGRRGKPPSSRCATEDEEDEILVDNLFVGAENVTPTESAHPRLAEDDSCGVSSFSDLNDFGSQVKGLSLVSNEGDFFDAEEVFSMDGSDLNMKSELHATRISLLEEIERRKAAENALNMVYRQWERVVDLLRSQTGVSLPPVSKGTATTLLDADWLEQVSQEVIVARFVCEAIGKGEARAEAELAAAVIIDSKDQEISRLRDRLQYYEAMNHEMSQRNLEVVEVARRHRERRKGRWKWFFWGCVGMSITIGASVIAYSYLPQKSEHPLATDPQPDSSCK